MEETIDSVQMQVRQSKGLKAKSDFTQQPNGVGKCFLLSRGAKQLWTEMYSYSYNGGDSFPSIGRMAMNLGVSKATIMRDTKELVSMGLVEIEHRSYNRTNMYTLYDANDLGLPNGSHTYMESHPEEFDGYKWLGKGGSTSADAKKIDGGRGHVVAQADHLVASMQPEEDNYNNTETLKEKEKLEQKEKEKIQEQTQSRGFAASPSNKSKDSITRQPNAEAEPLREYGQESNVIKSYQEMPGTRFGEIIVLGPFEKVGDGKWDWIGLCPCGRKGVYSNEELLSEKPKVCICKLSAVEIMQRELDRFEEMRKPFEERPGYISKIKKEKSKRIHNRKNSASIRTWTEEDREWKKLVNERDNCTCQKCGNIESPSIKIIAHHIDGYKENVEKRLEIDNGVTLCSECYNKFHSIYGRGNNTREQFAKFMEDKKEILK